MVGAPITYALQFRGQVDGRDGLLTVQGRATSSLLVSVVDRSGPHGRFEEVGSGEAILRFELDPGFEPVRGHVDFGSGTTLALEARERRPPAEAPRPHLRHGAAILEVTGGTGELRRASGWVASNYLLSDTGDLTDTHLGLLFVERP